jgi:hypothetical protein
MNRLLFIGLSILVFPSLAFAVSVDGLVTLKDTKQPATRALIVFMSNDVEKARTITGDDGRYSIRDIPEGTYSVRIFYRDKNLPTETTAVVGSSPQSINFQI